MHDVYLVVGSVSSASTESLWHDQVAFRGGAAGQGRRREGDGRTYDYVVGLRAVTSTDGMAADFSI